MKNKDIQFFFNRPDRPVNSGRITGIRKGIYAGSKNIPEATTQKTNEFISKFSATGTVGAIVVPAAPEVPDQGPMSPEALKNLFEEVGVGIHWRLKAGETDEHECKTSFGFKHAHSLALIAPPTTSKEGATVARAIMGLPKGTSVPIEGFLAALKLFVDRAVGIDASTVRRALCRVDELFFEL